MGKDKLNSLTPNPSPNGEGSENLQLVAEEGATLSKGSIRLYGQLLPSPLGEGLGVRLVGCIDLYNYDPLNRRCAVGIMVATEYRRQGYALAMLKKLEELYSQPLNIQHSTFKIQNSPLHSLYADIAAINTASINLFRKAGYEKCGRFKEWLEYDSHFIDNIRMQLIL